MSVLSGGRFFGFERLAAVIQEAKIASLWVIWAKSCGLPFPVGEGKFVGNLALDGVWNGFFCTFMR